MRRVFSVSVVIFLALVLCGCAKPEEKITITNPLEMNTMKADTTGYRFLEDDDPALDELDLHEALRLFEENGTGVLFFGAPSCPICQRAIAEIDIACKDLGVRSYYVNTDIIIDALDFRDLLEYTKEYLEKDSNGSPNFRVPRIFVIKDGEIQGTYLGLPDSVKLENENSQMTAAQKKELQDIYKELMKRIAD
ncbi:MAG: hypothetical protein IJJ44_00140 [Solobacterium sp.]|nr:hypothetical protein [Solobacterium sp.]